MGKSMAVTVEAIRVGLCIAGGRLVRVYARAEEVAIAPGPSRNLMFTTSRRSVGALTDLAIPRHGLTSISSRYSGNRGLPVGFFP